MTGLVDKDLQNKVKLITQYLDKNFPNVDCELNFSNNLELIIAVLLSAQCKDEYVNRATKKLFEKYKTIDDYADAKVEDIEKLIKTLGLYKAKSKNIVGMANMLRDVYDYKIPTTREELIKLPGVGRKTANVVLSVGFNIPAIAVDTHVERVAKMFGLADKNDNPLQVEKKLMELFPMKDWGKIHHQLIHLGRYKLPARGEKNLDAELEKLLINN
ncbi:endonuclease III [Gemella sanguinis]|jgi:endonuclease III|uniref:Endonuclease III n=1 Tax=Gemella sanguinis TaxID=84135 RepID=A0ABX6FPN4_9BACL|nr:endonuclease III [Gemella sanguinis]QGS08242.1 endonuclease III [Gemella sanguinis]